MYCEKCGKANPNDAVFCEGCGARVSAPPPPPRPQQQVVRPVAPKPRKTAAEKKAEAAEKAAKLKEKVKNLPKKVWVLSGAALVVLLAFFIFLGIGGSVNSPKTIAKRYFQAMQVDKDVEKAFNYLYLETSEFVNKKTLATYLEDDLKGNPQIVKFVAEAPQKPRKPSLLVRIQSRLSGYGSYSSYSSNDDLTQTITVKYVTSNGEQKSEYIQLFDTGQRSLLLWKKYAVSMNLDRIIVSNVQLVVPKGSTVTVDGIALKNPEAADDKRYEAVASSLEVYTIGSIFRGDHAVVIKNAMFDDYETDADFYSDRAVEFFSLELNQATRSELYNETVTIIQKAIASRMTDAPYSSLGLTLTANTNDAERVQYNYENYFKNKLSSYTSVKPKTFEDNTSNARLNNGMRYSCRVDYVADCVYSSWGGEQQGDRNFNTTITWAYENGAWVVATADF